jgi:hypothetical protein
MVQIFTEKEIENIAGFEDLEKIMIARYNGLIEDVDTEDQKERIEEINQIKETIIMEVSDADPELCALLLSLHSEGETDLWFDDFKEGYRFYGKCNTYEIGKNRQWAVIPESDIDDVFKEYTDNYVNDCILPEVPENIRSYFDYDKFNEDAQSDGYGIMSSYDGQDNEQDFDDNLYHILRLN